MMLPSLIKIFSKDMSNVADIFLWNDLNIILQDDRVKTAINKLENDSRNTRNCSFQLPLIATSDWWVTAQLEYLNLPTFDNKKFKIMKIVFSSNKMKIQSFKKPLNNKFKKLFDGNLNTKKYNF